MDEDKEFFEKQRETQEQHEKHRTFFEEDEDFFKKFDTEKEETKGGDSGDPTFFMAQEMSREEVIKEVKKNGMFLQKVSGRYGDDIEVVSLAVENNAKAYAFASKRLQADEQTADTLKLEKQVKLKEAQSQQSVDPAILAVLQEEIETINRIHFQARQEKQRSQSYGQYISM